MLVRVTEKYGPRLVNRLSGIHTGGEARPVFFDIEKTCPALLELDRNFRVIREELDSILPELPNIPRYHELDSNQTCISAEVDSDRDWRVFLLNAMGQKP